MAPTQATQMGLFDLIAQSGFIAKMVLLTLLGASVMCWSVIFIKWRYFRAALLQNKSFTQIFWSGKAVDEILAKAGTFPDSPLANLFKHGIKELKTLSLSDVNGTASRDKLDQLYRSLSRSSIDEIGSMEKYLGWLGTTASAAPFIGLFGTVCGIITSFQSIGATGNANLAVVAPGISEALVTTAAGIGAAIPAVVAHNFFSNQIKKMATEMENFTQDFINIVQRSTHKKGS